MSTLTGIYETTKKDGTIYYRVSVTHRGKHISLGSYGDAQVAHSAYLEGRQILADATLLPSSYVPSVLSFDKCVVLMNVRDHGIYFKTPIYMGQKSFLYYYDINTIFTFDIDDLFYYASHKIMKRGRHLFVADYGMQVNILTRYGIRSYGVEGKDYYFANGDAHDFRYENVICLNPYHGVELLEKSPGTKYLAKIHLNGDTKIGVYDTLIEAAIAYNKAVDKVKAAGCEKNFPTNYVEGLSAREYAEIYAGCEISKKL